MPTRNLSVLLVGLAAAATAAHAQDGSQPVGKSACAVLSAAEVSPAAGATLAVDPDQSGPDGSNRENCVWTLKNGPSVTLQIERQSVPATAALAFTRMATIAFGRFPVPGKPSPQPVTGLGNQSLYRNFEGSVKGGAVVVQKGQYIWSMSGDIGRQALIDLARLVGSRL